MCGQNLKGGAEESDWKDRGASPVYSRTSTLCELVDTVTGRQEEPDGEAKGGAGRREGNSTCHSLEGQGELGKVLNVASQLQEENA